MFMAHGTLDEGKGVRDGVWFRDTAVEAIAELETAGFTFAAVYEYEYVSGPNLCYLPDEIRTD